MVTKDNRGKQSKIRVVCAMSGGVDSSVAAALLKKQKYEVIGVFLKFWSPSTKVSAFDKSTADKLGGKKTYRENACCNQEALVSARNVASSLKIPFHVFDVSKKFKAEVVDYYVSEYEHGRTPNPCVMCNKFIKFGWLLEKVKSLGADFLATGHYARLKRENPNYKSQMPNKSKISNANFQNIKLLKAKDTKKDQSYFLWTLAQDQLKHILFPIGDYTKTEVRSLAKRWHLAVAKKPESQDICFIANKHNDSFLDHYGSFLKNPGDIVDLCGKKVGEHKGLIHYTIGQRQGVGNVQLVDRRGSFIPVYVVRLNIKDNQLVVGREKDLYSRSLVATRVNWINSSTVTDFNKDQNFDCEAKIRYQHPAGNCQIVKLSNCFKNYLAIKLFSNKIIKVTFNDPQRAITPGQAIVFYKDNTLLGGGIIE